MLVLSARNRSLPVLCLGIILLLSAIFFPACTDDTPARILVFSKTEGYRHASIPTGIAALRKLCRENGMLMDTTEDGADFNEKNLRRYHAVVFLSTTGDVLNPAQEAEFERYIQAGGGFVGIHAASDTEYGWAWFGGLVGGYFNGHPAIQNARLTVENHDHPATKHLGPEWKRRDEWYNFRNLNPNTKVLLKIDEKSYEGGANGADHPMSWYHEYDGGRAFYTALGHTDESFSEPDFMKHLLGGIKYAIGDKKRLKYAHCRTPELPDPTRFVKTVLASELTEPMEFDMFPDGKIILIERRGAIKIFNPNTGLINIAYHLPVHSEHEDGLMGLALDPNWEKNHWIYLYYSPVGNKAVNYLSRFKFADDTLDRTSEVVMLEVAVQREECCHAGGCIEFDEQGLLYLSTGDNTNPFASEGYAPIDERPGRGAWDAQKSSGNTMDLRGKILRIQPLPDGSYICPAGNLFTDKDVRMTNPGSSPEGNPTPDPSPGGEGRRGAAAPTTSPFRGGTGVGAGRPEIYVMGCRNPFRISVDSRRHLLFWGEVGPDAGEPDTSRGPAGHDEVNRARKAGFFGWPYFVGNNKAYREYDFRTNTPGPYFDPEHPVNNSPNNTGARELPPAQPAFIWYPYGNSKEFPLVGNGGRNAMAGPVYYCDKYPAATRLPDYYHGKLLTYDWMRGFMMAVTLDTLGDFGRMEPICDSIQLSRPMDMLVDKKGSIWVLEYGTQWFSSNPDARLSRIDYVRGNRPPIPHLDADKIAGATPCTVVFSAAKTKDYDDDRLKYQIDFGDGSPAVAIVNNKIAVVEAGAGHHKKAKMNPTDSIVHVYAQPGTYEAVLTVTDAQGAAATAKQKISVGNEPPAVRWDFGGKNRSFYEPGTTLNYQLLVSDLEDGSIENGGILPASVATSIDYLETGFDITQIAQGHQTAKTAAEYARGKVLLDRSDCNTCHAVDRQINGPSFQAIATRYRKDEFAVRNLSQKVIKGGAGNWGQTVMSAHPQVSEADAGEMVRWILSLGEPPKAKQTLPVKGEYALTIPPSATKGKKPAPGTFILNASYKDRGSRSQSALDGSETIALRPAFQQAEQADSMSKNVRTYRPFNGDTVVLNELKHNSFFVFRHVDLRGIYSAAIGLGSGDKNYRFSGGRIELRLDRPDGLLVGSATVPAVAATARMQFSELTAEVSQAAWPKDGSFHDLYFVVKNEKNPAEFVTAVDWVRFNL